MPKPQLIVITPVRNEAWVLEAFLTHCSSWADHIIIADQHSTDGSREIAQQFPKVTLIDNPTDEITKPMHGFSCFKRLTVLRVKRLYGQWMPTSSSAAGSSIPQDGRR